MPDHLLATPVPSPGQLRWQEAGLGIFLHFGLNTFNGVEWSDGTLDPASFDPTDLDARQWVETARLAGARYVVLTAKHHDGFCLWPTETTRYSVAASPWRGGRGDVVAELAEACRAAGMGLGLYLSPWDRNAECYADPEQYDAFYRRQLTELCTRYGPLVELWFDGAGSEGRTYDWDSIMAVVREHQPGAMVFNMGEPTIRWIGNEDGLAADPVHYVVGSSRHSIYATEESALGAMAYLPPECDVPIRRHWFWQPDDRHTLKSREHLLAIWYRSVGLGAGLLLNVPPDRRGLIDAADRARLLETTDELVRRFADPLTAELRHLDDGWVRARFAGPVRIDHLELREDLTGGQRIFGHDVRADGRPLVSAGTVGVRRIHAFPPVTATELTLRLDDPSARLRSVIAFETGASALPELEEQPEMLPGKMADEPARTT